MGVSRLANVTFKNVYKRYPGDVVAVKDFNLEIIDKEFIVLVGPSGCGKSTSLRMVAGLEDISEGEIYIGDKLVNEVQSKDRDIAMVFQNYALYPHMTVYENMSFGLRLRKMPKEEIDKKVRDAAKVLDIEQLLDRKPKALSGGQRQRVALGRAIVRDPKVFLMDEPLSNLDAKLRVQTRTEIKKLHDKLEATFIYVTHDQTEAMTMGDRIVIMKDGVVQQVATPMEVYNNPSNVFVAGFIGSPQMNFFEAKIEEVSGLCHLKFDGKMLVFSKGKSDEIIRRGYSGKEVIAGVRPEDIKCSPDHADENENMIQGVVDLAEMLGAESYLYLESDGIRFIARVDGKDLYHNKQKVSIIMDQERIHLFDKETKESVMA